MKKRSAEPVWIEQRDALAIHDRLLAIHGGAAGIRDQALHESALARPRQHYSYTKAARIFDMAALYMAGIVRNHPFPDGNKRTGFVIGVLFLELNGFDFRASEADAAETIMKLAAGSVHEKALSAWLKRNCRARRSLQARK